jgi:hypothetical protein
VLLISPNGAAPARYGMAIRAGVTLEALSRRHDVSLAVVSWQDENSALSEWARTRASEAISVPVDRTHPAARSWVATELGRSVAGCRLPSPVRDRPPVIGERIADAFGTSFDVVMVTRTYLAAVAIPFLEAGVPAVLDACDDESLTCASLARFDPAEGEDVVAYDTWQRAVFPWFERVLFASIDDAQPPFEHYPNAVPVPVDWTTRAASTPLELLFVGLAGYAPNRDAVERLADRIVPGITALGADVRLRVPGPDDDLGPFYDRAHIAVVPLRAGGGTRIKILEAFARGCPIVSTPKGAEGLDVVDGRLLVVTDDDDDDEGFARAVVDLARDDERRVRLAAAARTFVERHHDARLVGARLAALVEEVARGAVHREDGA